MNTLPTQYSIRELFTNDDQYVIPMYQRNYAWEEGEITQLIQDILDCLCEKETQSKNYYIGTLVVFERREDKSAKTLFETIDGQQRLTTLILLASFLEHNEVDIGSIPNSKLRFDSREKSSHTLDTILSNNFSEDPSELLDPKRTNQAILNGYQLIGKNLRGMVEEKKQTLEQFAYFLLNQVQLIRVKVPDDTDLNHYFEIMNNRGEQLEKHEILKALLLREIERLPDPKEKVAAEQCLHAVWESCANMEKYVQMGFKPELRNRVFGDDWNTFVPKGHEELATLLIQTPDTEDSSPKDDSCRISDIIQSATTRIEASDRDPERNNGDERFHSPINFQNFLLHVLRVLAQEEIPLDDKRLIPTFQEHLIKRGPEAIKYFTFALLKSKWYFDQFVIKREFANEGDDWSLKQFKKNAENSTSYKNTFADPTLNARILKILAAFHVSTPTMVYKHWLNGVLHYLLRSGSAVSPEAYLQHLESLAQAFVFDRHLAVTAQNREYFDIIYRNMGKCMTAIHTLTPESLSPRLTFGTIENNLIFNYLDYLLWLKHKATKKVYDFKFTFRSSVEHYYPQNPEKIPRLDPDALNSFGNLCLISHSKNSRLSNFPPDAKKSDYLGEHTPIDSVKQYLMMENTTQESPWNAEKIAKHTTDMIQVLLDGPVSPSH